MRRGGPGSVVLAACLAFAGVAVCPASLALQAGAAHAGDTDGDGLSDTTEQELLVHFLPEFLVSVGDCSGKPARFDAASRRPVVLADDGTIYGQVTPRAGGLIEIRYFHLWRRDCGEMGHALDTEHVAVLVRGTGADARAETWYASAHEDTVCDASHMARAETLGAATHGATVWISDGKHASFLAQSLCTHGCGGDRCERMAPVRVKEVINLGEPGSAMNGIAWLGATEWPLREKMQRTDFGPVRMARMDRLPENDVVWANPAKRPAQAAILGVDAGRSGALTGAHATDVAFTLANDRTGESLETARDNIGNALGVAAAKTGRALQRAGRGVLGALKKSADTTETAVGGR